MLVAEAGVIKYDDDLTDLSKKARESYPHIIRFSHVIQEHMRVNDEALVFRLIDEERWKANYNKILEASPHLVTAKGKVKLPEGYQAEIRVTEIATGRYETSLMEDFYGKQSLQFGYLLVLIDKLNPPSENRPGTYWGSSDRKKLAHEPTQP